MTAVQDEVSLDRRVNEATAAIRKRWDISPRVGVVLGSGLSCLATVMEVHHAIPYGEIPNFPCVTALGHRGKLLCGILGGAPAVVMDGRCHRYEGHSLCEITLPVRAMHRLGIELLVLSNASGGLHPRFCSGDVMLIEDHINLMWGSPLQGFAQARGAVRFEQRPDLITGNGEAWRSGLLALVTWNCMKASMLLCPVRATKHAQYRFLRSIGADVVGMSTVPEAIVAGSLQLPVLALSAVTNVCRPDCLDSTSGEAVLAAAATTEVKMQIIVGGVLNYLASQPRLRPVT